MTEGFTVEQWAKLVDLAGDAPPLQQEAATWFLRQGPAAAPVLARALEHEGLGAVGHVRILRLLARLSAASELPAVRATLRRARAAQSYGLIMGAMNAVAALGGPEAVEDLLSLVADDNPDVVKPAAVLLGRTRAPAAREPLLGLLRSPRAGLRHSAVQGLLALGDPEANDALARHLAGETDAEVRALLSEGLGGAAAR